MTLKVYQNFCIPKFFISLNLNVNMHGIGQIKRTKIFSIDQNIMVWEVSFKFSCKI